MALKSEETTAALSFSFKLQMVEKGIKDLAKLVFESTAARAGPTFDGQWWWQAVFKKELSQFDNVSTEWAETPVRAKLDGTIWPALVEIPEYVEYPDGSKDIIKEVHFFAQLCRLPRNRMTLRKLCQVMLNAAQLGKFKNSKKFTWPLQVYLRESYSDFCKLDTYADHLDLLAVALHAVGFRSDKVIARIKENIRIFDSGI